MSYSIVRISSLPSLKTLQLWQNKGIKELINVSGVDLFELYEKDVFSFFNVNQIEIVDVFTSKITGNIEVINEPIFQGLYVRVTNENQRTAFVKAVKIMIQQLVEQNPTYIFCHRGLSRSPLVVAAAFQYFYQESIAQAVERTRAIHPPAQFTELSLSALKWCSLHLPHYEIPAVD